MKDWKVKATNHFVFVGTNDVRRFFIPECVNKNNEAKLLCLFYNLKLLKYQTLSRPNRSQAWNISDHVNPEKSTLILFYVEVV